MNKSQKTTVPHDKPTVRANPEEKIIDPKAKADTTKAEQETKTEDQSQAEEASHPIPPDPDPDLPPPAGHNLQTHPIE